MDGHFVPNLTFGPKMVADLHQATRLPLDVHLMIERPDDWVDRYVDAGAAYVVEFVFGALGLIPTQRNALVVEAGVTLNYTTVLNVIFLALAAVLVWRFRRTGGPEMLTMMDMSPDEMSGMGA